MCGNFWSCLPAYHFITFFPMIVPTLTTLLLLDVSISSAYNSSLGGQLGDTVVPVGHLNRSLPSANNNSTVAEDELESDDDSEQDNTEFDSTEAETRSWISSTTGKVQHFYEKLSSKEDVVGNELGQHVWQQIMEMHQQPNVKQTPEQIKELFAKLANHIKIKDEDPTPRIGISVLLESASTEIVQSELLRSKTKLSAVFDILLSRTQDGSLTDFFKRKLHVPMLSYACKYLESTSTAKEQKAVSQEMYQFLTADRQGKNFITMLGTYDVTYVHEDVDKLINLLTKQPVTRVLAARLNMMRNFNLSYYWNIIRNQHSLSLPLNVWLELAAFTRFSYIEHEAMDSAFVLSQIFDTLTQTLKIPKTDVKTVFSAISEVNQVTFEIGPKTMLYWKLLYPVAEKEIMSRLDTIKNEDEVRLLKATLQNDDQVELVRAALKDNEKIVSFEAALDDQAMKTTFQAMLKEDNLVQLLNALLEDNYKVQLLKGGSGDQKHLEMALSKSDVKEAKDEAGDMNILKALVKDEGRLQLLKASLVDDDRVKLFKEALEAERRLKSVEDMLSGTDLNMKQIFNSILAKEDTVRLLQETVNNNERLKLLRIVLKEKKSIASLKTVLGDDTLSAALDEVLKDVDQVFFLRLAINDENRLWLFRMALTKQQERINKFEEMLDKRELGHVFRTMIENEEKAKWLGAIFGSPSNARDHKQALKDRDLVKLAGEMIKYMENLESKASS
ncbi:hypothetical protein Plhal703r1_c18g0082041 [Plasmopara halstedii]